MKKIEISKKVLRKRFKEFQYSHREIVINHYKRKFHSIYTNFFLFSLWIELINQESLIKERFTRKSLLNRQYGKFVKNPKRDD